MSVERAFARPVSKREPSCVVGNPSYGAYALHTGSIIDKYSHDILISNLTGLQLRNYTPYANFITYLDFPSVPDRAIQEVKTESSTALHAILIDAQTNTVTVNPSALIDELPHFAIDKSAEIAIGLRLQTLAQKLSREMANLQEADILRQLKPGFDIAFVQRSRLGPSSHQVKTLLRASTDGRSARSAKYMQEYLISEKDINQMVQSLVDDKPINITIEGRSTLLTYQDIYTMLKKTKKADLKKSTYLPFLQRVYGRFLDSVASELIGSQTTTESLLVNIHDGQTLQVPLPIDIQAAQSILNYVTSTRHEVLAFELSESDELTLPLEQIAHVMQKMPERIVAQSPVLQLYEVLLASAGYDLFDQEHTPIKVKNKNGTFTELDIPQFIATPSAWPDLVVGAVDKNSDTWKKLVSLELTTIASDEGADEVVEYRIYDRLARLFRGHMLNLKSLSDIDMAVLDTFLVGLAKDNPEAQLIIYETKTKLMVDKNNSDKAAHSLNDVSQSGLIDTEDIFFMADAPLSYKNEKLPGIRDSVYAVALIDQLYRSLGQLESFQADQRPELDWQQAIELRGCIAHLPILKSRPDTGYYFELNDKYGIEIIDYKEHLDWNAHHEVATDVAYTLGARIQLTNISLDEQARGAKAA